MQGQLVKRKKTVTGVDIALNPYSILEELSKKRYEYNIYLANANAVRQYNSAIPNPSTVSTWFGVKVVPEKTMPGRPTAYTGDTFLGTAATASIGGYGKVSTGEYTSTKGYKPFGALGYGTEKTESIALDTKD